MDSTHVLSVALIEWDRRVAAEVAAALDARGAVPDSTSSDLHLHTLLRQTYTDQQTRRLERIEAAQRSRAAIRSALAALESLAATTRHRERSEAARALPAHGPPTGRDRRLRRP